MAQCGRVDKFLSHRTTGHRKVRRTCLVCAILPRRPVCTRFQTLPPGHRRLGAWFRCSVPQFRGSKVGRGPQLMRQLLRRSWWSIVLNVLTLAGVTRSTKLPRPTLSPTAQHSVRRQALAQCSIEALQTRLNRTLPRTKQPMRRTKARACFLGSASAGSSLTMRSRTTLCQRRGHQVWLHRLLDDSSMPHREEHDKSLSLGNVQRRILLRFPLQALIRGFPRSSREGWLLPGALPPPATLARQVGRPRGTAKGCNRNEGGRSPCRRRGTSPPMLSTDGPLLLCSSVLAPDPACLDPTGSPPARPMTQRWT
mmetsp:Transcript_49279/g.107244  ORF Transcript_49279/g.107244 Transcript_49279/m.107244 type:complete len:310 (-) Transcript_49279:404-1333(-)